MEKKKVYAVATAHLDTVWRWNLATTIKEYLPNTLEQNFNLIEKYPNYRFNFEGAFRYALAEEYYPKHFEYLKELIKSGKWNVAGSSYENGDVNISLSRSTVQKYYLRQRLFQRKIRKRKLRYFSARLLWLRLCIAEHYEARGA